MLKLIKNARLFAPEELGMKDILLSGSSIVDIQDSIDLSGVDFELIDAEGKFVTPGLIDQHIHIIGAGGKHGFVSMTPEVMMGDLIACGTTTVMGLLGTDGSARSLSTLYAKAKSLDLEGITAYILTSYFGLPAITITGSIMDDMVFVDKIIGCKTAVSDERSSFPSAKELLEQARAVRTGGLISGKKGILHIHLGGLKTGLEPILELVRKYQFPIEHLSPTHLSRTRDLLCEAVEFSKLGGMIDISTGGTTYAPPHQAILHAIEQGASIDTITMSSDGNAGIGKLNEAKELIGFKKAPFDLNLKELVALIKTKAVSMSEALKVLTVNPAKNMGLKKQGAVRIDHQADLCFFDDTLQLTDVIAKGRRMMVNGQVIVKGYFEN